MLFIIPELNCCPWYSKNIWGLSKIQCGLFILYALSDANSEASKMINYIIFFHAFTFHLLIPVRCPPSPSCVSRLKTSPTSTRRTVVMYRYQLSAMFVPFVRYCAFPEVYWNVKKPKYLSSDIERLRECCSVYLWAWGNIDWDFWFDCYTFFLSEVVFHGNIDRFGKVVIELFDQNISQNMGR